MDFLVFETKAQADKAERIIFEFGKALALSEGYVVDDTHVYGRNSKGKSKAFTSSWDTPRQRVDGKWVITHPKHHTAARDPQALQRLTVALGHVVEEEADNGWWPEADL